MYRRIEEEIEPTVGLPAPKTFRRILSPSTDTGNIFTVISRNRPIYSSFKTRWGNGGPILILTPGVPMGRVFHITNFPFQNINIPSSSGYGVFISQLIWYARACSSNMYDYFTSCQFPVIWLVNWKGDIFEYHTVFTKAIEGRATLKNVTCAKLFAYGLNWETNGGRRGILSNVIATGDIQWKCRPVRKVI